MKPTFQGEMQLMNWGESSQSGAWVKFWIESESLESFRDLKTKSGKIAGHRMMAVLVEINDQEEPMQREPEPLAAQEKPMGGDLARMAGVFCNDPVFWEFLMFAYPGKFITNEADAACAIRTLCCVKSRAELDHSISSSLIFHNEIRKPFLDWKEQQ